MTTQQTTAVAVAEKRQPARVENTQPLFDTDRFEHFQRAASALMHSSILNPSIRGDDPKQCFSNLMLVFDLSDRWKLPPMSIAQCISIVHNKVVYEGKLIQAALQSSLGVQLYPWWTGKRGAPDYRIYLSDKPWDTGNPETDQALIDSLMPGIQILGRRVIDGSVAEWKTTDKQGRDNAAWTGAATQNQLNYRGSREWVRRYEPAMLLGVYGDDEIEAIQGRMDRAREVSITTPGLSTGFTKPAAEEPVDAVVEEIQPEADTTDEASAQTALEAKAEPTPSIEETGSDDKVDETATFDSEEVAAASLANADDESQADDPAFDSGDPDDDFPGDRPSINRLPDEPDAVFITALAALNSWPDVKRALSEFSQTPFWKGSQPSDLADIRSEVWHRLVDIIGETEADSLRLCDLTAFRCWIETAETSDELRGVWSDLVQSGKLNDLEEGSKTALAKAVTDMVAFLDSANG